MLQKNKTSDLFNLTNLLINLLWINDYLQEFMMKNILTMIILISFMILNPFQINETLSKEKKNAKNIERLKPIREFKIDEKRILRTAQRFAIKSDGHSFKKEFYYQNPYIYCFISKTKKRNKHILIIFNSRYNKDEYLAISYILENKKLFLKSLNQNDEETLPIKKLYNKLLYDSNGNFLD